jgi:hypothetical protein
MIAHTAGFEAAGRLKVLKLEVDFASTYEHAASQLVDEGV